MFKKIVLLAICLSILVISHSFVNQSYAAPHHPIFAESLSAGWSNWSWKTTVNFNNTSPVYSAPKSIGVTHTGAWGGLSLHHAGLDTTPYSHLEFYINPQSLNLSNIRVALYNSAGVAMTEINPTSYATDRGGGWRNVLIPLAALNGVNKIITRVQLQEATGASQPIYYVDELGFISREPVSPTPSPTPTPNPGNSFQKTLFENGLDNPTSMAFAPDGRLFVAQKSGALRVIKNGNLLATPFLTMAVDTTRERGLLGVAIDPNFSSNKYIYIFYTNSNPIENRISRFTASNSNPDIAQSGSENILLGGIPNPNGYHNAGALHFGTDGKLYGTIGDGTDTTKAQSTSSLLGKLIRINADGTIPSDNPFYNTPGARREIWALGFRNPFTFEVDPITGKVYVNDVGQDSWEEINAVVKGGNYGWPTCEGVCNNPAFINPIHAYDHSVGSSITGGVFYRGNQFPSTYVGNYFFADYIGKWIKFITPANQVLDFAFTDGRPVDLDIGSDGSLYYLSIDTGSVFKIAYITSNHDPVAVAKAIPTSGGAPLEVNFNAGDSSDADGDSLSYHWDFGDGASANGITATHTYTTDGAYIALLTVTDGKGGSATDDISIVVGNPPQATITTPSAGTMYNAGDSINYSGTATDPDEGNLPASSFSWTIVLHHASHTHPFLGPINGVTNGSFKIPDSGTETSHDVFYRINLTVTDSSGLKNTTFRDVLPRKSDVTLATNVSGLKLTLDGQPVTSPYTFTGVVGMKRTIEASSPQTLGGITYNFVSWSDGGTQSHIISTPNVNTTYTATFQTSAAPVEHVIYAESLNSGWSNWSWKTTVNLNNTSPVFAGTKSIGVTYTSAWGGLLLRHAGLSTGPYSHLQFYVNPAGFNLSGIRVSLYNSAGNLVTEVNPASYATDAGSGWRKVLIPLSALGGVNTTITRVQLQDATGASQPIYYLDNLRFVNQ